jgi:DNA-binding beta-propeller fold protein YncE
MGKRKRYFVLLSMLFFVFACFLPLSVQAEVEWSTMSTLNLDQKPLDIASTPDGQWIFILTTGEVLVQSQMTKKIEGRISVDKDIDRIAVSPRGEQLFLTNEKTKTLSVISVKFIQQIDIKGSPFKGPANVPVVIAVFEDFQ